MSGLTRFISEFIIDFDDNGYHTFILIKRRYVIEVQGHCDENLLLFRIVDNFPCTIITYLAAFSGILSFKAFSFYTFVY